MEVDTVLARPGLECSETAREHHRAGAQCLFRVHPQAPGERDHREEQVAHRDLRIPGFGSPVLALLRLGKPAGDVLDACERVANTVQRDRDSRCHVEADARRTFLDALRMRERRQRRRHAVEERESLALLGGLELLPVDDHAGRTIHRDIAEHVRMPVDHLGPDIVGDITNVEAVIGLHRDGAVHQHLKQQIAEFLAQRPQFHAVDCLEHLIGFLEQVGAKAAMRLLAIPRASTRGTQTLHHLVERAQRVDCLVTHGRSAPQPEHAAVLASAGPIHGAPA